MIMIMAKKYHKYPVLSLAGEAGDMAHQITCHRW
jgi:hypothetical protein